MRLFEKKKKKKYLLYRIPAFEDGAIPVTDDVLLVSIDLSITFSICVERIEIIETIC